MYQTESPIQKVLSSDWISKHCVYTHSGRCSKNPDNPSIIDLVVTNVAKKRCKVWKHAMIWVIVIFV